MLLPLICLGAKTDEPSRLLPLISLTHFSSEGFELFVEVLLVISTG